MNYLYFVVLGCKPVGRVTEQHDVFFGIGESIADLVPQIQAFWPDAGVGLHIDSFRRVRYIGDYSLAIVPRENLLNNLLGKDDHSLHVYFINLGGYRPQDMEEYHFKQLIVADAMDTAIVETQQTVFCTNLQDTHVDNKYALDIDDCYQVEDLLTEELKNKFHIQVQVHDASRKQEDTLHIGYLPIADALAYRDR